ncbi:hypothetical protein D3C81_1351390 [compost metagenome]
MEPPQFKAALWQTPSIPRANPLTIAIPLEHSSSASHAPVLRPYAVGTRVPTIAIDSADSSLVSPFAYITHGARSVSFINMGYD